MRDLLFIVVLLFGVFQLNAQSQELARNFFDQGEFEKALKIYQQLAHENPGNPVFFYGVISSYQQLENFDAAEELLRQKLENTANNPNLLIELGHNFELRKDAEKAEDFYKEALNAINARPNYAYGIARGFEKYNLLDKAAKAYEKGMALQSDHNFNLQLARIYGEQGKIEEMFDNYLDLIDENPNLFNVANREFGRYISEDSGSEANLIFRKLLLKKLQENPQVFYNEMLAWLFIQQKDFKKAFAQQKAVYRRGEAGLQDILNLALLAERAGDSQAAKEIVTYVIEEAPSENIILQGKRFLLNLAGKEAVTNFKEIETKYLALFEEFGRDLKTLDLQLDYARFIAFKSGRRGQAIEQLRELSEIPRSNYDKARVKMELGDMLVLEEKFNEALIYYSQVQNLMKNDVMSQQARFKVAKTSYFKGDFKWAKTQLDVLKSSTSQLIANDAMELSLLIEDNSIEDTAQVALKKYARADLVAFQGKEKVAIAILDGILADHKGESIEDEVLLKQAQLYEKIGEFEKAESNYLKIIRLYNSDILADNANYYLAELYARYLDNPERAKGYYEQIIFNFADSIYFVDARKKYRRLRGDIIE
ncbi:MAG TPA: tetratricopeptide repeat protein [Salegentibacter sp.]|uniref:tetratricopeptide repeat protein n=1 Tax=Salegentibacter sp. TaxID=1903072 RepID=UPI002F92268C